MLLKQAPIPAPSTRIEGASAHTLTAVPSARTVAHRPAAPARLTPRQLRAWPGRTRRAGQYPHRARQVRRDDQRRVEARAEALRHGGVTGVAHAAAGLSGLIRHVQ